VEPERSATAAQAGPVRDDATAAARPGGRDAGWLRGKGSVIGVVLAVLVFAGLQNALLLTNFNQEAAGIVTGGLLLASVFVPNAASLAGRLRSSLRRSPAAAAPGAGARHD
jgi:ABC-type xylose transport system permease subunit